MVGDAHIYIISNGKYYKSYNNDVEFWLKYLPELSNLISKPDQTEQLALEQGKQLFAMILIFNCCCK